MGLLTRILFATTSPSFRRFVHDRMLPATLATAARRRLGLLPTTSPRIERLTGRLWGGFSEDALEELCQLASAATSSPEEQARAHYALSSFHLSNADHGRALQHAEQMGRASAPGKRLSRQVLLQAECLALLDRREEARLLLQRALAEVPSDHHLRLALANTWGTAEGPKPGDDDPARLAEVNRVYQSVGLATLAKRALPAPLSLDNLMAEAAPKASGPLVSVLMPAYAVEATLPLAVRSVLEQTWQDLELLIVDDQSPDGTFGVAEQLARADSRIRVFRLPSNSGAYAARNFALSQARGEFITVHDADDWSHPQKLQLQVERLLASSSLATSSDWVRTFDHLYFRGNVPRTFSWITWNASSILARADDIRRLGGWDAVRVGADSELKRRLQHRQAGDAILHTLPGVPLSFALDRATSLTRSGATHVTTAHHGIRKTYHDASRHWLARQSAPMPAIASGGTRPFPAPLPILAMKGRAEIDVLVVGEFLRDSPDFGPTWQAVSALVAAKLRVGVLHWPGHARTCREVPCTEVLDAACRREVYVVSPGEDLVASAVVATSPSTMTTKMDRPPTTHARAGAFLVASPESSERGRTPLAAAADDVFMGAFGVVPTWLVGPEALVPWLQSELSRVNQGATR